MGFIIRPCDRRTVRRDGTAGQRQHVQALKEGNLSLSNPEGHREIVT